MRDGCESDRPLRKLRDRPRFCGGQQSRRPEPPSQSSHPFSFEVLVSAGPRKDPQGYQDGLYRELGEDCAGLVALPGLTLFWLADGTSDEAVLPGFSARILAQDAGATFAEAASTLYCKAGANLDFLVLVRESLAGLLDSWQARFHVRWQGLQQRGQTGDLRRTMDLCGDGWSRKAWSSTFVAGCLRHDSLRLEALNLGDGAFLVEQPNSPICTARHSTGRLWICVEVAPGGQASAAGQPSPQIKMLPVEIHPDDILRFDRLEAVLCMSDGATSGPIEDTVKTHGSAGLRGLAQLFKGLRQKTYDDRTMILGRLLEIGR